MRRTVIISSNDNPDYLKYYPYVAWAWNQLGWDTLLFYNGKQSALMEEFLKVKDHFDTKSNQVIFLSNIEGYRSETIVQVSRLFGGLCFQDDRILMTGDVDMIPLSDYWQPQANRITTYGRNLSDRHFPICYIAMPAPKWREIMGTQKEFKSLDLEIKRLLDTAPAAKSDKWEEWWQVDQDIITEILSPLERHDIGRELDGHLALGRADRYDWTNTVQKPNLIDAHMPRPFDLEATKQVLQKAFNKLPDWL